MGGRSGGMRPKGLRQARFNELLKEEVSILLLTESSDPRLKNVMLTQAVVSVDLKHASLYYRTLAGEGDPETQKALDHAIPFLRHHLIGRLEARSIPELTFHYDDLPDRAAALDRLLDGLHEGEHHDA
jgi:ribosome-binding factor A